MAKDTCSVEGCARPAFARSWCTLHYQRWKRHGDPVMKLKGPREPLADRFWAKVNKDGPVPGYAPHLGRCWVWTGALRLGYGLSWAGGRHRSAHHVAYELLVGPIPDGLDADHLCRNPACVRPSHIEFVTHRENVLRGDAPTALNARATHCKYGHEFTPENTLWNRHGRTCRTCLRANSARFNKMPTKCPTCGLAMTAHSVTRHRRRQHGEER